MCLSLCSKQSLCSNASSSRFQSRTCRQSNTLLRNLQLACCNLWQAKRRFSCHVFRECCTRRFRGSYRLESVAQPTSSDLSSKAGKYGCQTKVMIPGGGVQAPRSWCLAAVLTDRARVWLPSCGVALSTMLSRSWYCVQLACASSSRELGI